jgi:hypothetical protein
MTVVNTLITNNFAPGTAAGIYASGPVTLINVSIVKNSGSADLYAGNGTSIIRNTIAWGGAADSSVSGTISGVPDFNTYNRIQGYNGVTSGTNLGLNGDFTLQAGSPCIDAGDDTAYTTYVGRPPGDDKDLAGNDRMRGTSVDIGAYEYQQ